MKEELRVGIVGSRRRFSLHDRKLVFNLVERLIENNPHRDIYIVSGACRLGADNFAAEACRLYLGKEKLIEFPVPKREYAHKGEYAHEAYARNLLIAQNSHVGYALVHPDRDGGTENTVGHYHTLKKRVYLVDGHGKTYLSSMDERNLLDVIKDPDKA